MSGIKFFERSVVMLFKIVYLVSLLFVSSAGEFYEVRRFVDVIRITFDNTVGTVIKKIQEVFVNVIDIGFESIVVIHFAHYGKTFMDGGLNIVFPQRREHHAHAFGSHSKEAKVIMNQLP